MTTFVRGLSAEESPLPGPELDIGNIVKLKKPYAGMDKRTYEYGVIAEHIGWNAFGQPRVSLYLYNKETGIYFGLPARDLPPNPAPAFVDFCASELILLRLIKDNVVFVDGFDLFPTCQACGGSNQHPFADAKCVACAGWGHTLVMRRVSA